MTDAADREADAYRWRRPGWDYVVTKEHPENRHPRVTDYTDLEPLYADSDEEATVTDTPERDPTRTEDVGEKNEALSAIYAVQDALKVGLYDAEWRRQRADDEGSAEIHKKQIEGDGVREHSERGRG